jgi:hypothetical protein
MITASSIDPSLAIASTLTQRVVPVSQPCVPSAHTGIVGESEGKSVGVATAEYDAPGERGWGTGVGSAVSTKAPPSISPTISPLAPMISSERITPIMDRTGRVWAGRVWTGRLWIFDPGKNKASRSVNANTSILRLQRKPGCYHA